MIPLLPHHTILALDASTAQAGIALWREGQCRAQSGWATTRGEPGRLVQAIQELCRAQAQPWNQLDAVLVGCGPGQYAGLRVSVTAAQALQLPGAGRVLGIDSPHAMLAAARRNHPNAPAIVICGDARRNHVWSFVWSVTTPTRHPAMRCIPKDDWSSLDLPPGTIVASPDFRRLQPHLSIPPRTCWHEGDIAPDPADMIRLALEHPSLLHAPEILYVHPPVGN